MWTRKGRSARRAHPVECLTLGVDSRHEIRPCVGLHTQWGVSLKILLLCPSPCNKVF